MAKIKHNNFLETVNEVFTDAKQQGALHLYAQGNHFDGRRIQIKNKTLFHFGTTAYLGLEQDPRLKKAAIDAIQNYGTQFPLSKSYISHPLYRQLEDLVHRMYDSPIIITKNSTLGHLGVIPSAVEDQDAIILDHQVHWSVQSAAKVLKNRSVPVHMIRHNHLGMLEDKIKELSKNKKRIWYMADGIYSMYGDYAPLKELLALCQKYPQLHLYLDDVHGMSWCGKNGTGYVLSEIEKLNDQILLFGTLSKTFGASGAVLACADKKMYHKIKTFGGPLTFSAQLEPASVGAAIASAKIHLSEEIYNLQKDLQEKTTYFNKLLLQTDLPLVDSNESPVFYIGTGMPNTGYNLVNRMMNEGFYLNLGIFPAVPVKNTGLRITISRHNQKKEIKALVEALAYHFPKALEHTATNTKRVYQAFKLKYHHTHIQENQFSSGLDIRTYTSIKEVDKKQWNSLFKNKGVYDWDGLQFLEEAFQNNTKKENNWEFRYVFISDQQGVPIIATFFTLSLWKEDMLAKVSISEKLEQKRKINPYYLTSYVICMGSLFTEGDHGYFNATHPEYWKAWKQLIAYLENWEKQTAASMLVLRDFNKDRYINRFLLGQGFFKQQMPGSAFVEIKATNTDAYLEKLSARNRKHYRKDILPFSDLVSVKIKDKLDKELERAYYLYREVQAHNLGLNTFVFPLQLFRSMEKHPKWEFICLYQKQDHKLIGIMFCYKNGQTYVPSFVGMDYHYLKSHGIYRQLLFQTIQRAITLGFKRIDFGMTAEFEKKKLGAQIQEKFAFIQASDNYHLELLGVIEQNKA